MITQYIALLSAQALGQSDDSINLDEMKVAHGISDDDVAGVANFGNTKKVKEALWVSSKGIVENVTTSGISLVDLYASINHGSNQNYDTADYNLSKSVSRNYSKGCHSNCHSNCHGSRGWR